MKIEWIRYPVYGNKTCDKIREYIILRNYPLYCLKCKQETKTALTMFSKHYINTKT